MKHSYKLLLLTLIIISVFLVGCEPAEDNGSNPPASPTLTPTPTGPPLQNACIEELFPDPDLKSAVRLTNICDFRVSIKFCLEPDGNPDCATPDSTTIAPGLFTRAFPENPPEYNLEMGVCEAEIDGASVAYDPGTQAYRDNQLCEKVE